MIAMLSERRPILLANARIVDPSRDLDIDGDLLIADGVIREAKRGIGAAGVPEGTEVIDCKGKLVAPGLIDMRAFVGEPGAEYRETIASASQAAAAGGGTTIICQPGTNPAIDEPPVVDFVLRRARDTSIVHVQPMAALTKGLRGEEMAEIGLLKAAGAVAFTDGARRGLGKRQAFRLHVLRVVIGHDDIDQPRAERGDQRRAVLLGAQRRLELEEGAVRPDVDLVEREMVDGGGGGDVQAFVPGAAQDLERLVAGEGRRVVAAFR